MMKPIKTMTLHFLTVAALVLTLGMTAIPANASFVDFFQGRVAEPGTSLYALGNQALATGLGGISYVTNGEGRVVKVRAKKMPNGDLRVTSQRVYIPLNYISKTQDQTLESERVWNSLGRLASRQPWVGGYAVLPQDVGLQAYEIGVRVETELRRNDQVEN
jgi:hypothetical protein